MDSHQPIPNTEHYQLPSTTNNYTSCASIQINPKLPSETLDNITTSNSSTSNQIAILGLIGSISR